MIDFARRAEEIRRELLALDLEKRPRVALVVVVEKDGRQAAHREPINIDVPDSMVAISEFQPLGGAAASFRSADTPQHRQQLRRNILRVVQQSAASIVARTVANLPAASDGLNVVDVRLEVIAS